MCTAKLMTNGGPYVVYRSPLIINGPLASATCAALVYYI